MTKWIGTDTFDDKVTELTVSGPARLAVTFADGARFDVDMASVFARSKYLAPLQDPELFAQAKIIFAGSGIGWTEELDYGGDALRQLAEGQTDMFEQKLMKVREDSPSWPDFRNRLIWGDN